MANKKTFSKRVRQEDHALTRADMKELFDALAIAIGAAEMAKQKRAARKFGAVREKLMRHLERADGVAA